MHRKYNWYIFIFFIFGVTLFGVTYSEENLDVNKSVDKKNKETLTSLSNEELIKYINNTYMDNNKNFFSIDTVIKEGKRKILGNEKKNKVLQKEYYQNFLKIKKIKEPEKKFPLFDRNKTILLKRDELLNKNIKDIDYLLDAIEIKKEFSKKYKQDIKDIRFALQEVYYRKKHGYLSKKEMKSLKVNFTLIEKSRNRFYVLLNKIKGDGNYFSKKLKREKLNVEKVKKAKEKINEGYQLAKKNHYEHKEKQKLIDTYTLDNLLSKEELSYKSILLNKGSLELVYKRINTEFQDSQNKFLKIKKEVKSSKKGQENIELLNKQIVLNKNKEMKLKNFEKMLKEFLYEYESLKLLNQAIVEKEQQSTSELISADTKNKNKEINKALSSMAIFIDGYEKKVSNIKSKYLEQNLFVTNKIEQINEENARIKKDNESSLKLKKQSESNKISNDELLLKTKKSKAERKKLLVELEEKKKIYEKQKQEFIAYENSKIIDKKSYDSFVKGPQKKLTLYQDSNTILMGNNSQEEVFKHLKEQEDYLLRKVGYQSNLKATTSDIITLIKKLDIETENYQDFLKMLVKRLSQGKVKIDFIPVNLIEDKEELYTYRTSIGDLEDFEKNYQEIEYLEKLNKTLLKEVELVGKSLNELHEKNIKIKVFEENLNEYTEKLNFITKQDELNEDVLRNKAKAEIEESEGFWFFILSALHKSSFSATKEKRISYYMKLTQLLEEKKYLLDSLKMQNDIDNTEKEKPELIENIIKGLENIQVFQQKVSIDLADKVKKNKGDVSKLILLQLYVSKVQANKLQKDIKMLQLSFTKSDVEPVQKGNNLFKIKKVNQKLYLLVGNDPGYLSVPDNPYLQDLKQDFGNAPGEITLIEDKLFYHQLYATFYSFGYVIVLFLIYFLLIKSCNFIVRLFFKDRTTVVYSATKITYKVLITIVLSSLLLLSLGLDPFAIISLLSVSAFALSLALRSLVQDFFSGLTLHATKMIRVGDMVTYNDWSGNENLISTLKVEKMSWRSVTLMTDNQLLIIPNSRVLDKEIWNFTKFDEIKDYFFVKIPAIYPPGQVKQILLQALAKTKKIKKYDKDASVFNNGLLMNEDTMFFSYKVVWGISDYGIRFTVREEFWEHAFELFKQEQIILSPNSIKLNKDVVSKYIKQEE